MILKEWEEEVDQNKIKQDFQREENKRIRDEQLKSLKEASCRKRNMVTLTASDRPTENNAVFIGTDEPAYEAPTRERPHRFGIGEGLNNINIDDGEQ